MVVDDIVVTGMGVWSAAGTSLHDLWHNARRGVVPAEWIESEPVRALVCRAPDSAPCPAFPQIHRMDRSARLALAAAGQAHAAARLTELEPDRIAILAGNSRGPVGQWQEVRTASRIRPTQAARTAVGSLSGALSLALKVRGPCLTVSATCASGAHAVALGAALLRGGAVDAVLAGGAEAPLVPSLLAQFRAAGLLGAHTDPALACRPFDAARNGMVPGEGAGFLVLERAPDAHRRGARIEAVLAGWAMGAESFNRVAARPDGQGLARTILDALRVGGLPADAIAHLNAHGTGTRVNDVAEAAALKTVFGGRTMRIPLTSTKPVTGHGFGATSAWEAILTILALQQQEAPPTAGWATLDPDIGLEPVHGAPRAFSGDHALSTSLGFWGNTAALIFRAAAAG